MANTKMPVTSVTGRLAGKVAVVTGAAGNLGGEIVRHYLAEGATVVMTGRTATRTDAAAKAIIAEAGIDPDRLMTVELHGADAQSVRDGVAKVTKKFGRIDILVNNAGSAGPKQTLGSLPLDAKELAALQKTGSADNETVGDAVRNIFGVTWNLVRAAAPAMGEGASIINVSTIFSRTIYYARTAYVVPKAALNALLRIIA
jgi:malonyl-CoA reductase / 3-hydroxypropionate dehydrogenase (NADP+)